MEWQHREAITLELKYCEGCGTLWFRRMGESEVYCTDCMLRMAEFAPVRRKIPAAQLSGNHKMDFAQSAGESTVCGEGGQA